MLYSQNRREGPFWDLDLTRDFAPRHTVSGCDILLQAQLELLVHFSRYLSRCSICSFLSQKGNDMDMR